MIRLLIYSLGGIVQLREFIYRICSLEYTAFLIIFSLYAQQIEDKLEEQPPFILANTPFNYQILNSVAGESIY